PLDDTVASWEESEGVLLSGIEIIKPVAGNFVRPTENTVPGKGFIDTETASRSFDIPISHYGVDGNLLYWNAKTHSNAYSCGFVFEDMKMFVALARDGKLVPMNFFDGAESEDALGNKRQNIVNIRWRHPDNPY